MLTIVALVSTYSELRKVDTLETSSRFNFLNL
jgi:hypothetical protein